MSLPGLDRTSSLAEVLSLAQGAERTAGLAAWFQGLYEDEKLQPPVLVGGAAVELYTGGSYVTGDLDFVGSISAPVSRALRAAGFRKHGRHWIHEAGRVFIELRGESLDSDARTARIRVGDRVVIALSPEDALIDRLGAWKSWKSALDGVNAFLLWRAQGESMDMGRARDLAGARHVTEALAAVQALSIRFPGRPPLAEDLERWARQGP